MVLLKRIVYRSRPFYVEEERMMVNGDPNYMISRVVTGDAVVIIPVLGDKIILERQYRPVIRKTILELPAGGIDRGETALTAARRELKEETGYTAGKMRFLFRQYVDPGKITYSSHFYVATGLKKGKPHMGRHEAIRLLFPTLKQILKMIDDNTITDTKTISGILYYTRKFR